MTPAESALIAALAWLCLICAVVALWAMLFGDEHDSCVGETTFPPSPKD